MPARILVQAASPSFPVGHLVKRPDLDLARSRHRVRTALHPGDGLGHVLDLPEPEARDLIAGRRERPVDHRSAGAIERNALALRGRLEPVGRAQDAGLSSSSLNLPMASIIAFVSGERTKPFSLSPVAFTSTITRIVCLLFRAGLPGA